MPDTPLVSVVIPTRNRSDFIERSVRSAFLQQEVSVEVIVVDDGSRDSTAQKLHAVADPRLRVLRRPPTGVAAARNAGIAAARGEWIAFLDDDDIWAPNKLESQLRAVAPSGATFVYTSVVALDEHLDVLNVIPAIDPGTLRASLRREQVLYAGCSNVLASADVVRKLGGFDERLHQLADWDMWLRLVDAGIGTACPEVLVGYVQHRGNMLATDPRRITDEFRYLASKYPRAGHRGMTEIDAYAFTAWVGEGYRRSGRRVDAARINLGAAFRYRTAFSISRAFGTLFGDAAMRRGIELVRGRQPPPTIPDAPAWLAMYR